MNINTQGELGVIYTRFSSQSQDKQTTEVQLKICRDFAKKLGITIVREFSDEAHTGRNFDRPDYKNMLNFLDNNADVAFVIVYKYDRFARNARLQMNSDYELEKRGIITLSTMEPYSNDANGRFTRGMSYLVAQYYSDDYSQRIRNGLDNSASNFQSLGGQRMLGYKTKDKKFKIVEKEAVAVRKIFEMYADGESVASITNYLNDLGYRTTKGNKFNKNSLHRMLSNKRYIGTYVYKGVETPNKVPRIVSDELFYKVQDRLKINKKAPARARAKNDYLLTTKLFCGHCESMMTGSSGTSKTKNLYTYYVCKNANNKNCDKKRISKDFIEDFVIDSLRNFLTDKNIDKIAKKVVSLYNKQKDVYAINQLKNYIKENNLKIDNLVTSVAETTDTEVRKMLFDKIAELKRTNKTMEVELIKEQKKQLNLTEDNIKYFLYGLKNGDVNTLRYRKSLINALVNKIYLYDDYIIIITNTQDESVEVGMPTLFNLHEVLISQPMLHQEK